MERSVILKCELKLVLAKMNMNKVAGPNEIVIEMQTTLGEFGTDKITEIKYMTSKIPENLSRSILIVLAKYK